MRIFSTNRGGQRDFPAKQGGAPTSAGDRQLHTYEQFWVFYVGEHSHRISRALHFAGTSLALAAVVAGVTVEPWWLIAAPAAGYGFAWVGHFLFEKNRPATFGHPWWSLRADFRMYRYMWLGRMEGEVRRNLGVS
jgi:hypothetical protein